MNQETKAVTKRDAALVIKDTDATKRALISRFGQREFGDSLTVGQFIAIANAYGLNPWMGHMMPFNGRVYIERDGWTHLINREAPGQLAAIDARQAYPDEYEQFKVAREDYFAVATIIRRWPVKGLKPKDWPTTTFTRRAILTRRQAQVTDAEVAARGRGAKARHVVEDPWDMALKQAAVRALRMGFNDCLQKATPEGLPAVEPEAEGDVLEAQATVVNGADWGRLWVVASEQGLQRSSVHAYFGAGPEDGDLKAYAEQRAEKEGLPLQQIVEDMADELQHRTNDPGEGPTEEEREAEERERQESEAALAQSGEPPDPGLAA
ncbi:MAG: hypothetical protein E3J29_00195 [Dehalococcoidia bacterium]|nr:MAG: hypothetical protein E3J29_00195 [Dehalococcoidia bacterium]